MNILNSDNNLATLNYDSLLKAIIKELEANKIFTFSSDSKRLKIDVDEIARKIAYSDTITLSLSSPYGVRCASINFDENTEQQFPKQITKIRDIIKQKLIEAIPQTNKQNIEQIINSLLQNLATFKNNSKSGFSYLFADYLNLTKQQLIINNPNNLTASESLLRLHKLSIKVDQIQQFEQNLKDSLEHFIQQELEVEDDDQLADIEYSYQEFINNKKSDFYNLIDIVKTEAVGKLKREAKILYLEYLSQQINHQEDLTVIYLDDLTRRLRRMEKYLYDAQKPDDYFLVNYQGYQIDYRDIFARAESLDKLPIMTIIEGYLGESTNHLLGEKQFVFGLKLKLNGKVQAQGDKSLNALDYYLNLLNPDSKEHQEEIKKGNDSFKRKVLEIAFLFAFIFASKSNPSDNNSYNINSELDYDPIKFIDSELLPRLRASDEEEKRRIFISIKDNIEGVNAKLKIKKLASLLRKLLKHKSLIPKQEYSVQIGIKKTIILKDIEEINQRLSLFKRREKDNNKDYLKYITVGESNLNTDYLCYLPVNFTIEDVRYFPTNNSQTFSMGYDIENLKTLPILFTPYVAINGDYKTKYQRNYSQHNLILITYNSEELYKENTKVNSQDDNNNKLFNQANSIKTFRYSFVFSLLVYICLKVILDLVPEKIFIPIMRLHIRDKNLSSEEVFMRSLSKTLTHLLRENHLVNTQGLYIKKDVESFRKSNALSSLYSILPKTFKFYDESYQPELEKLAIIIISSRETDASYQSDTRISNLLGEVITLDKQGNLIKLQSLNTFSANYEKQEMYRNPTAIVTQIHNLYQQGYRHFLYIAKSPYTSNLNLTTADDESLYFASKSVLKNLKGDKTDIKIYPVFFDKYYVVKLGKTQTSLYIQDTADLTNLFADNSQKSVVFFNLFNGIKVGNDEERFYHGVVSYSTLLNTYDTVIDDQDIRQGLIYDQDNKLKQDILQYLTLFHFSRYEKQPTKNEKINLKLDPYETIIGDSSVAKHSLFSLGIKKIEFNSLGFLTEVRRHLFT